MKLVFLNATVSGYVSDIITVISAYKTAPDTDIAARERLNVFNQELIYRGYYTAVRRHEFYLRVVKTIFHE